MPRKPSTTASNTARLPGWKARRGVAAAVAMLERGQALIEQGKAAGALPQAEPVGEIEVIIGLAVELCMAALEGRDVGRDARGKLYHYLEAQDRADDYWKTPGEGED